jgi:hypothetical protein
VILALALAALGYFLFHAPMWCGAETRTGDWRPEQLPCVAPPRLFTPPAQVAAAEADFHSCRGASCRRDYVSKSVSGALGMIGGVVAGPKCSSPLVC